MQLLELWTNLQPDSALHKRKTKQWQTIGQSLVWSTLWWRMSHLDLEQHFLDCQTLCSKNRISFRISRWRSEDRLQGNGNVGTPQSSVSFVINKKIIFLKCLYISVFLPKNSVLLLDISSPTLIILNSGESNYYSSWTVAGSGGIAATSTLILHTLQCYFSFRFSLGKSVEKS